MLGMNPLRRFSKGWNDTGVLALQNYGIFTLSSDLAQGKCRLVGFCQGDEA